MADALVKVTMALLDLNGRPLSALSRTEFATALNCGVFNRGAAREYDVEALQMLGEASPEACR